MKDRQNQFRNIFNDLGIGNMPPEEQEKFFADMNEVVELAVIARMGKMLSDEDKKAFDALNTDDEKENFLKGKGIDINAIAIEEASAFRERLIADVNYIAGRVEEKKNSQGNQAGN